jgi:hypothetical protein
LPPLYKEGIYDDSSSTVQSFVLILNPTDSPKTYSDAFDIVKQKYPAPNIFEVPMSRAGGLSQQDMYGMDDLWEKYCDLDTQLFINENNALEVNLSYRLSFFIDINTWYSVLS